MTDAPKTPSVTVSPSGEIEEGSSVTLSCSSDANPAAEYTWFKEQDDSVEESGQNYTLSDMTSEHGGNYYCQAHNAIGLHNSTFLLIKGNFSFQRNTNLLNSLRYTVKHLPIYVAFCLLCLKSTDYVPVTSSSSSSHIAMVAVPTIAVLLATILLLVLLWMR